ncbi:MAG: haloacid dehalogenase-like hydrolase [Prevotella sp.]|nr:haloacid dehalogenase-like hydrolase [Prevotella sp.]
MDFPLDKIHAFDFDGTLTERDTLLEFIRFNRGNKGLLLCLLRFLPFLVGMKLGICRNWKVKQMVFSYCFKGMSLADFDERCRQFADGSWGILRPKGIAKIKEVLAKGERAVVISASIDNWVKPFFRDIEGVMVVGTTVETKDGLLTGRFLTKNCFGAEKVNRLLELFPKRTDYWLTAYGDSRGDFNLLDFANEGYYRPFE